MGLTPKTPYIEMCAKRQILLEFSLTWIRLTCLMAFHMPWDHLDSTLPCPIEELYKEPFGYIERGGIEEQENYSSLLSKLGYTWVYIPLSLGSLCVLPNISFYCEVSIERWMIEVVEAQVEDSVSLVCKCADKGCHSCNLWFILIEISFPVQWCAFKWILNPWMLLIQG